MGKQRINAVTGMKQGKNSDLREAFRKYYNAKIEITNYRRSETLNGWFAAQGEPPAPVQQPVSYGEIVELEKLFDEQATARNIRFRDDEHRAEALFDFVGQYIDGNENPEILDA